MNKSTLFLRRRRVFLGDGPLVVSGMEALFIGLLCWFEKDLDSPFRYYYLLSLVCCAIRHPTPVTYATWALHSLSFLTLYAALPDEHQDPAPLVLTLVIVCMPSRKGL